MFHRRMAPPLEPELDVSFLELFLDNPSQVLSLGVIALLLGVMAIVFNSCVIAFYVPKYREVYPMLYLFNCASDCIAGVGAILTGILLLHLYQDEMEKSQVTSSAGVMTSLAGDLTSSTQETEHQTSTALIGTIFCVVSITIRVSVICSLTISVVRMINIVWAQYKINCRLLLGALVSILLFWIAFIAAELYLTIENIGGSMKCGDDDDDDDKKAEKSPRSGPGENNKFPKYVSSSEIEHLFLQPFVGKELMCELENALQKSLPFQFHIFLLEVIPFIIPVILATIILILTSYKLLKTPVGRNSTVSRNITITVAWLTIFYIVCHVPFFVVILVFGHPNLKEDDNAVVTMRFVTTSIMPFLGTCLNSGTLIVRGSKIRRFYTAKISVSFQSNGRDGKQTSSVDSKRVTQET